MKKLLFLAILVMVAKVGFGQTATPSATATPATTATVSASADFAVPVFAEQVHDFGKVKQGQPVSHEFTFTNTGKAVMVITNVQASCGCTTPDWSKDPIAPGGKGFVRATYNAAGVGGFDKSVTITANVEAGAIALRIRGEVVPNVQ